MMDFTKQAVRHTSAAAFKRIRDNGLLSRMRWRVYSHLYQYGPMTGHELDDGMATPGETMTSYHKRLSELERLGVARIVGKRICKVTGHESLLWDVTAQLPNPAGLKRQSWRMVAERALDELGVVADWCEANGLVRKAHRIRKRAEEIRGARS